jgi:DnaJ like chaperone protein
MFENFLGKTAEAISKGASAVQKGAEAVKKAQENANIISEEHPLSTAGLEIYPNRFKFKKQTFSFADVTHIKIYWKSTTTNGVINTQKVEFSVIINNEKQIYTSKKTMYVAPKLVKAYNYIAQKTFDHRLKFYTDQLEKKGYFNLEDCSYFYNVPGVLFGKNQKSKQGHAKIYTDGRVLFEDKKMSMFDASISRGRIDININSDESFTAHIDYNDDVVSALVNFILQNPQDSEDYINNYKNYKETKRNANIFLDNSISLMAKLAYADGVVSPEEVEVVKEFLSKTMNLDNQSKNEMLNVFNQAKYSPKPFEYYANILLNNFNSELLSAVLDVLFLIAIADGTISAEEELLLLEAEAIFGIKGSLYNEYKSRTHTHKQSRRENYLDILGLDTNATQDEIKKTYRRLAMKFHPDRVNHLGEEFIQEAESKMKEINAAYEYLKKS